MSRLKDLEGISLAGTPTIDFGISGPSHSQGRIFVHKYRSEQIRNSEQPDFLVHAALLKEHIDIGLTRTKNGFPALCLRGCRYATVGTFNKYLNWLYCGQIPLEKQDEDEADVKNKSHETRLSATGAGEGKLENPQYEGLARLYSLARYLHDQTCQEAVLDTIAAKVYGPQHPQYALLPGHKAINILYDKDLSLDDQSMAWYLFMAIYTDIAKDDDIRDLKHETFKQDLLLYVLQKFKRDKGEPIIGSVCDGFHLHGYKEECPSRKRRRLI